MRTLHESSCVRQSLKHVRFVIPLLMASSIRRCSSSSMGTNRKHTHFVGWWVRELGFHFQNNPKSYQGSDSL